jgi:hypothetical protein
LDQISAKAMNLEQWCQLDERIYVAEMDERYRQHAGLKYNERAIEQLAEMRSVSARTFLGSFSRRELFLSSVENIADSSTKKLELEHVETIQQCSERRGKTKAGI